MSTSAVSVQIKLKSLPSIFQDVAQARTFGRHCSLLALPLETFPECLDLFDWITPSSGNYFSFDSGLQ